MDLGLKDKTAVVTGGSGGIGKQTCLTLAAEGANVAVADLDMDKVEQVAEQVQSLGVKALALQTDVTKFEQAEKMIADALKQFGKIDILNNVAGVAIPQFFVNSKPEHWEMEINACLYGTMNCCKAVFNAMAEQNSGKIVNVASDAGKGGEKLMVSYSAAKAGIMGFTRSLAKEMGRHWVNVNAVCPGTIKNTGMTALLNEELEQKWVKQYALRRLGQPEDIANMIVFLSSSAADWITGQSISVNGGYFMG
jgi:NAD(P)-dependent dehydrogenase (short-subunit alcohol dehydrogenase family)